MPSARYYGPTVKAFAALDDAGQATFAHDLLTLANEHNTATPGTLHVPGRLPRGGRREDRR